MTTGIAVDPGTKSSAWISFDTDKPELATGGGNCTNGQLLEFLSLAVEDKLVLERIAGGYGRIGDEVIQTIIWSGRFMQAFGAERTEFIYRSTVRAHICGTCKGTKDMHVSAEMRRRFGDKGTKANKGGTYGYDSHMYQALALATTYRDMLANGGELPKKKKAKRAKTTNYTTPTAKCPQNGSNAQIEASGEATPTPIRRVALARRSE